MAVVERGVMAKCGVVAKQGVVAEHGDVTKQGAITKHGIITKRSVVPECGAIANRGVVNVVSVDAKHGDVAKHGINAKSGIVAKRGVIAKRGIVNEKGVVPKCGIVNVVAVDGVTKKRHFVGVGSMDPTFARLPNTPVNEDMRFLPALMSVDAAVQGNWSGANTDRSTWMVQWTWKIMSDNISNPDATQGLEDLHDNNMPRQCGMVGYGHNGRQEEGNAMRDK